LFHSAAEHLGGGKIIIPINGISPLDKIFPKILSKGTKSKEEKIDD
jgi:hypothetical protein